MLGRMKVTLVLAAVSLAVAGSVGVAVMPATPAGAAEPSSSVTIADLCSCTGPEASSISQTTATMQAWTSWVNSHGGLAGHQVKLVVLDDGYSAVKALANAQSAVNQDHAVAIFDNSDEDPSFASVVRTAKVPVLGGQETDSGWQNADFFPAGATFNYTNSVGAIVAKNAGVKKMSALYCVEVAICARVGPPGPTGGVALWDPVRLYSGHRVRCTQLHGAVPGGQAVRRDCDDRRRRLLHRRARGAGLRGPGFTPRQLSSDGTVAIAWLKIPAFNGNIDTQSDFLVVRPQLCDGDDVCGARQVRAASAQRTELR